MTMAFITSLPVTLRRAQSTARTCNRPNVYLTPVALAAEVHPGSQHMLETLEIPPRVALTREEGKNEPLRKAIESMYEFIEVLELPCVKTTPRPGALELPQILLDAERGEDGAGFDWVVVTSPEAASFLVTAWNEAGNPSLPAIAAVGRATGNCVRAVGLDVAFEPSKALGKILVKEFPESPLPQGRQRVLYAGSALASTDLQTGLDARGYNVTRVDTYTTEQNVFVRSSLVLAEGVHIVTFASPSAVKAWVSNVGVSEHMIVACIGATSARAAREAGFEHVHYPDAPGIDGWMKAVCEAMKVFERQKETAKKE